MNIRDLQCLFDIENITVVYKVSNNLKEVAQPWDTIIQNLLVVSVRFAPAPIFHHRARHLQRLLTRSFLGCRPQTVRPARDEFRVFHPSGGEYITVCQRQHCDAPHQSAESVCEGLHNLLIHGLHTVCVQPVHINDRVHRLVRNESADVSQAVLVNGSAFQQAWRVNNAQREPARPAGHHLRHVRAGTRALERGHIEHLLAKE
mmetsp:Transcript_15823/g.26716  ORF Transcript_15823/g.26716 Transcript_15823/m.26716 type:complete len:203 (+) Transcript_15823:738-1346(+)